LNPLKGVALKIVATLIFTIMAVFVKLVADDVPTGQVVFCRQFFAILPIMAYILVRGDFPGALWTTRPVAHASRIMLGTASMALGFTALALIPLPDATAIGYAMPIFAVIFAALILKETVRIYRWTAVIVGLGGVLVILSPHLTAARSTDVGDAALTLGAIIGLVAAVSAALAMVTVRHLTMTESTSTIVFWFSAGGALLGMLTIPVGVVLPQATWVWPSLGTGLQLVMIGLLGGVAQILQTQSYRYADASVIAPFEYTSLVWSVLLGWWIFGDVPGIAMLIGSLIVILAGLFVIWRERQLGIERTREREAGKPGA
jgi:drug/metabolite transporter (DMT)-like permease